MAIAGETRFARLALLMAACEQPAREANLASDPALSISFVSMSAIVMFTKNNKSYYKSMPKVIETSAITQVIDLPMDLGRIIHDARKARGWSQADLAKEAGVTQPAILKIEKSRTRRSKYLPAVLRALGLPLNLLTQEEDLRGPNPLAHDRRGRIEQARRILDLLSEDRLDRILAQIEDAALVEGVPAPSLDARAKGEKEPL